MGAISTQFPGSGASFAVGAMTGSFYGAKRLRPIFAKPSGWRTFEAIIGLVMARLLFAYSLVKGR